MTRLFGQLVVVAALAGGAGCSGPGGASQPQDAQESNLREVADLIRAATSPGGKGPTKAADFDKFQSVYSRGCEAVKSGEVVVVWGGGVKGEGDMAKGGGEVIAYEKNAPTAGGWVLLTSGEVKKLSAAEFTAAPKAGKK